MVVLELEGHSNMLGAGPNQYLQPDYMGPLASSLDSKQSPLALLAQTCSQIGADSPPVKSLLDSSKRKSSTCSDSSSNSMTETTSRPKSSSGSSNSSGNGNKQNGKISPSSVSTGEKSSPAAFRPYEASPSNFGKDKSHSHSTHNESRRSTTPKVNNNNNNNHSSTSPKSNRVTPPATSNGDSGANLNTSEREKDRDGKRPSSRASNSSNNKNNSESNNSLNVGSESSNNTRDHHSSSSSKKSALVDGKSSPIVKDQGASPIIRSGLEVLQGNDYRKLGGNLGALSSLSAFGGYPSGFDPTNPAFRPPFSSFGPSHSSLAAAQQHFMGFPHGSPYIGYSRVKSASGSESIVPVCKDPYCTGCQFNAAGGAAAVASSGASAFMAAATAAYHSAGLGLPTSTSSSSSGSIVSTSSSSSSSSGANGGFCPAGCVQCDHPKFPFPSGGATGLPPSFFHSMGPPGGLSPAALSALGYPQSLLSQHAAAAHMAAAAAHQQQQQQQQNAAAQQRPYVCNWIVGDNYCGKRFVSSEELLQHLRTHTNSSALQSSPSASIPNDPATLAAMIQQHQLASLAAAAGVGSQNSLYSSALLNSSAMVAAAMHRNYPTPPLSPLSAARYHPYANAAGKAGSLGGFPPAPPPSLASYYSSPYSLYGQKIGPPVHP